jgi:hypothetical protein
MSELTLEAAGMTREEIAALPTRKTWYGIVGTHENHLVPEHLTDDPEYAKAKAKVANVEYEVLGPWRVVELLESLRTVRS